MKSVETHDDVPESGALFITIVICILLVILAAGLAYNLGQANPFVPVPVGDVVKVEPTDLAKKLKMDNADVHVVLNLNNGYANVEITPKDGFVMPAGATIEAYLVDGGTVGDFGTSSETKADEFYGQTLSNGDVDTLYDQIPYALSFGRIKREDKTNRYAITYNVQNTLTPYDQIVLTLESDTERSDFDPRPGAVLFRGSIPNTMKSQKALNEADEASDASRK